MPVAMKCACCPPLRPYCTLSGKDRYAAREGAEELDLWRKAKEGGEMKVGTAHRLLTKEILKQLTLGNIMLKLIEDSAAADPEIHERLINLEAKLCDLANKPQLYICRQPYRVSSSSILASDISGDTILMPCCQTMPSARESPK